MKGAKTKKQKKRPSTLELKPPFLSFKKLDYAAEISYYYGFMPIKAPTIEREDVIQANRIDDPNAHKKNYGLTGDDELRIHPEEKIALLRTCEEQKLISPAQPLMLYYEGIPSRTEQGKKPGGHYRRFNLDVLGTTKSVAEAELIKASLEILRDKGFKDLYIDINSIGDKDSTMNFAREISQFYRKHGSEMQTHCRTHFKKDVFAPVECTHEKCRQLSEQAPKSVSFLSEPSRAHFAEALEFLESMHIPYKIDNHLLGDRRLCCHTIFLIKTLNASDKADAPEETLALGYRYNSLAKKLDMKRDIPGIGVTILFKERHNTHKKTHRIKNPQVYFIQFGFDAKLKSLELIETLRNAKIPLHQSLAKDKLSSQLQTAENMKIPYVLIMGQKESLEGSVIVRNMTTRFQETVPITELPTYLKELKK